MDRSVVTVAAAIPVAPEVLDSAVIPGAAVVLFDANVPVPVSAVVPVAAVVLLVVASQVLCVTLAIVG